MVCVSAWMCGRKSESQEEWGTAKTWFYTPGAAPLRTMGRKLVFGGSAGGGMHEIASSGWTVRGFVLCYLVRGIGWRDLTMGPSGLSGRRIVGWDVIGSGPPAAERAHAKVL